MEKEISLTIAYVCVLFLLVILTVILFMHFMAKRLSKSRLEKKQMELDHQQELYRQVLLAQETERKRIAEDIHDEISSRINVINLNAELLKGLNISLGERLDLIDAICTQGRSLSDNARRIAYGLLPPELESFGLVEALKGLMHQVNSTKAVVMTFREKETVGFLSKENQLHIFRIVQELVNNSINHGKAANIFISLYCENGVHFFSYDDNGIGFDCQDAAALNRGLGMSNIKSRIQLIGGMLHLTTAPGKGFALNFKFSGNGN